MRTSTLVVHPVLKHWLAAVMLAASVMYLACFGIFGISLGSRSNYDFAVMYAAGRAWLARANPYNQAELIASVPGEQLVDTESAFAYPPQSAAFFVPAALLDFRSAKLLWLLLNIAAIAAIAGMTAEAAKTHGDDTRTMVGSVALVAFVIGNPFTSHTLWQGQTSLVALAAAMAGWRFDMKNKHIVAGVLLGIASLKPQVCLLPVIWLLLERRWRTLAAASATAACMSVYPILLQGPIGALDAWRAGLLAYRGVAANSPGFEYLGNLQSLLAKAGLPAPDLTLLAVGFTAMLWFLRKNIHADAIFGLLMAAAVLFMNVHVMDYVWLIPTVTWAWLYSHGSRWRWVVVALVGLLVLPLRSVRALHIPVLMHWRSVVILILLAVLFHLTWSVSADQRQSIPVTAL